MNDALLRYEVLFKAKELSGNDLISWFKQLIKLRLKDRSDANEIYLMWRRRNFRLGRSTRQ